MALLTIGLPLKPFSFVEGLPPIESTLVLKSNDTPINKLQTETSQHPWS